MNAGMKLAHTLRVTLVIAAKDIADALKNRNTVVNIVAALGLIVFFDFMLTQRPFDHWLEVVVYDQGGSDLVPDVELSDGMSVEARAVDSLAELRRSLGYRDLGLVLPAGFGGPGAGGDTVVLDGYVNWFQRARVAELEATYTRQVSEWLGQPVRVAIGENTVQPAYNTLGAETAAGTHLLFAIFYMAVLLVPLLMVEEKRTRTLEALQVAPVSGGQLVLGKMLAGLFYVALAALLAFWLNRAYVIRWDLALVAAACSALFCILLSLFVGSLLSRPQQMMLWMLVVMIGFLIPAWFVHEPNLVPAVRTVMGLIPTGALATLFLLAVSVGAPSSLLLQNLALVLGYAVLLYALIVWQVRRADR
ncbi:MAG: ABC transporter permease [Anaerolineae bacterium]|nr:ABC transporter permease [Anaerolineae bacterium]